MPEGGIFVLIQARMGSSRLPGKVLMDIHGKPMLERVVERARIASLPDEVVVLTSREPADRAIVEECERIGVRVFCGAEDDVLDRYYQAAQSYKPAVVVRLTGDCPLIDPTIVDHVIDRFVEMSPDYASNTLERTYPRGLDAEVFSADALTRAWRNATQSYQRAHVTPYIIENPSSFQLLSVCGSENHGDQRWVVDVADDLEFVRAVYDHLGSGTTIHWKDVVDLLVAEPSLLNINAEVGQKAVEEG